MAYAKFGEDSDVYVWLGNNWKCSGCNLEFDNLHDLRKHLREHVSLGDKVPKECLDRIDWEIEKAKRR